MDDQAKDWERIEFRSDAKLTLENGKTKTASRFKIGQMTTAQVRCYVIYANDHYIEVADIEMKEGVLRCIPCSCFMFIDKMD